MTVAIIFMVNTKTSNTNAVPYWIWIGISGTCVEITKQVIWQSHGRIKWGLRQLWEEECRACKKDGSRFTCGMFKAENNTRENSRKCFFQYDSANGLPAGCAEGNAHCAEGLRNSTQCFFRCADNDRQGHDRKCK